MMTPRLLRSLFALFSLAFLGLHAQSIDLQDYTGRGFPPDLVSYTYTGPIPPGGMHLRDGDGQVYAVQITPARENQPATLHVVTDLPAEGRRQFSLQAGPPPGSLPTPSLKTVGDTLHVETSVLGMRLPVPQAHEFPAAVAASTLPAPILAFRHAGGDWLGAGRLDAPQQVRAFRVELLAEGPVFVDLLYRLDWQQGGYYEARVRIIEGLPLVQVTEHYDSDQTAGSYFELDLTRGWQPDVVETASHNGNGAGDPRGALTPLTDFFTRRPMHPLSGDQAWRPRINHIGLFRQDSASAADYPLVGVVPLRKGLWRRATTLEVTAGQAAGSLVVRLPLGVRDLNWIVDGSSETSPFSTHEHDPELPASYGRRVWGLALALPAIPNTEAQRPVYQLHRLYGNIGLDRYKDYILEWPTEEVEHPRLTKAPLEPLTAADIERCLKGLRGLCNYYFQTFAASHHHTSGNYRLAFLADRVLAEPDLEPAIRAEIRKRLALITHIYEDGDMMSYGNGYHHGNPNMGTARFWSGPCFAALIPDHPMAERWAEHMLAYGHFNLATQIAPGGAYVEFGAAYHMHGFARTTNGMRGLAALAGQAAVRPLYTSYVNPSWRYYMNLLTPFDSRWQSRLIPGLANSQPGNTEHFLTAAASIHASDPQLARELAWTWEANGSNPPDPLLVDPAVKPQQPDLGSSLLPGVGVVLRAGQGPDHSWLFMRSGFNWSHWYIDPGHVLFMSRGANLLPFQSFQYGTSSDASFDPNNTIRFGHPENQFPYGWPDSNIQDYAFTPSVDYAWSSTGFPDWFITPGQNPVWSDLLGVPDGARKLSDEQKQQTGPFTWDRQLMLMKSRDTAAPDYLVVRDSTTGDGSLAAWLNLRVLGGKDRITSSGRQIHVDTQWETDLSLWFANPAAPALHEQLFPVATHNSNVAKRVRDASAHSPDWLKEDGTPWERPVSHKMKERNTILRIPAEPGQGFFWLLWPHQPQEPMPAIERLADGVLKIRHAAGTDYVLFAQPPTTFEGDGVLLEGRAAAVRIAADRAELILASGSGRAGYRGHILESAEPFTREVPLANLKPGRQVLTPLPDAEPRVETVDGGVRFIAPNPGYVELSHGSRGVRGMGPFDLTFKPDQITGSVTGRARTLVVSWPEGITRPMYTMNGTRFFAGWADDPSIPRTEGGLLYSLAFAVTDGEHTIAVREWTYPPLPPLPPQASISGAPVP